MLNNFSNLYQIKVNKNVVTFNHNNQEVEILPIRLFEQVDDKEYLDKQIDERLFDPSFL
jgi:hypothetical protein